MNTSADVYKETLVEQLVEYLERMYAGMRSEPTKGQSEAELTMPQFRTLMMLSQEPQRMGAIAGLLSSSLSSATSMIDRLLDKGLVERVSDSTDRRVVVCRLTDSGREEIESFWRIGRLGIARIAVHLTTEELRRIVDAIHLLYTASQRVSEVE